MYKEVIEAVKAGRLTSEGLLSAMLTDDIIGVHDFAEVLQLKEEDRIKFIEDRLCQPTVK